MFCPTKRGSRMKKKVRSSKGMTLTELLVALMIVALIGAALTVGVNSAVNVYRDSTRLYEAETLCGTILTSLEDEFRFGRNIRNQTVGSDTEVLFDSQTFGNNVKVIVDGNGKIMIGPAEDSSYQLLNNKAYTSGLKVLKDTATKDNYDISYDASTKQITIKITVGSDITDASVTHTVTVAPLEK